MRYELFLRGAAALDDQALEEAAALVAAQGPALRWEPYRVEGVTRGLDVIADLDQPGVGALLCRAVFGIAAAQGLTVFDPQQGRPVMEGDAAQIEGQIERARAFAEAAPLGGAGAAATAGLSPGARLWLIIGVLLVGAVALARGLSCLASR
jgi:hypothetical protein